MGRSWVGMSSTVFAPARESASTLAFMATLRLHSSAWQWVESPQQARWWVIDAAACADLPALVALYDRLEPVPRVAFLAAQLSELPRPAWTFFKPPVKSGLIFNWVRPRASAQVAIAQAAASSAAAMPWRHGLLHLRRWPNISRYGNTLELTVACSRLLAAPADYEQVLQWSVPAPLLDQLLADAHREGLLHIAAPPAPAVAREQAQAVAARPPPAPGVAATATATVAAQAAAATAPEAERSRWDLVKRLLGKFAFK